MSPIIFIMNEILSTQNFRIKQWKKLKNHKDRQEQGLFFAEGRKLAGEALSHTEALALLVIDERGQSELIERALQKNVEVIRVNRAVLESVCDTKTPQDALIIARLPQEERPDYSKNLVALEDVSDPGNVGAIIRTADAAGMNTVILSAGCAHPYSPKVVRASMGSVFHVNVVYAQDFVEQLKNLKCEGFDIVAGSLSGTNEFPTTKICVLVGNEGRGLTEKTLEQCTHTYKIPMRGEAESLNAAVAASLMIYLANGII